MSYGFVAEGFGQKLFQYLTAAGLDVARGVGASAFAPRLSLIIALYVLALYLLVTVFQGIAWWLCHGFVQKQAKSYYSYMIGFAKITSLWAALFMVYAFMNYGISLAALMRDSQPGQAASTALLAYVLIVVYLASVSYAVQGNTFAATLRSTARRASQLRTLAAFALIAVGFALLGMLLSSVSGSPVLRAFLQVLIVLPLVSTGRILLIAATGSSRYSP